MNQIEFGVKNVVLPDLDYSVVKEWLVEVASVHGFRVGALSYLFCDDEEILSVNRQFLQHDYYTDIITFDYTHGKVVSGDIVISLDTVSSNAMMLNVDAKRELLRVIVHGLLHLCGINDKGDGEREIMEREENLALSIFDRKG